VQNGKSVLEAAEQSGTGSLSFSAELAQVDAELGRLWSSDAERPFARLHQYFGYASWDPGDEVLWGTFQVQLLSVQSAHRFFILKSI